VDEVFMHHSEKMSSTSGVSTSDPTGKLPLDSAGGLPSFRPPHCPPLEKILRAPMFAGSSGKMTLNGWFQHSFYRDLTTATHCCLVCQGLLFSLCSGWWMQRLESSWTYRLARPCETSVEAATMAAGWAKYYVQAVSVYALHPHRTSTTVPVWLCIHRCRLRSTCSSFYVLPRTRTRFGERGFFYSCPAAWNTLPSDLHDITDTSTFRKRHKTVVFDRW